MYFRLFFCTSAKIRALATALTNDFCSVANLRSPFIWLEDIVLQCSKSTNDIDKGRLLRNKFFFSIYFEVVWEIRAISHWCPNFLTSKIQALYTLWLSVKFSIMVICLWFILTNNLLTWPDLLFFFFLVSTLTLITPSLRIYVVPSLGTNFLSLEMQAPSLGMLTFYICFGTDESPTYFSCCLS